MSYERGIAAIRLEMPDKIPGTEYLSNPNYISHVTGIPQDDPRFEKEAGRNTSRSWTTTLSGAPTHRRSTAPARGWAPRATAPTRS